MFPRAPLHRFKRLQGHTLSIVQRSLPVALNAGIVYCCMRIAAGLEPPYPRSIPPMVLLSYLCVFMWSIGSALIDIVLTERLRLRDYDSTDVVQAMGECLKGSRGLMMQILCMHDLSYVPSDTNKMSWRRTCIFADDSGARWHAFALVCTDTIQDISLDLHKVSERADKRKKDSSYCGPVAKWNTLPSGLSKVCRMFFCF